MITFYPIQHNDFELCCRKLINKSFPDHILRMSLWKDSFTRLSDDILLDQNSKSFILSLDNSISLDKASKINMFHLYFDLIDSFTSVPFASASSKVAVALHSAVIAGIEPTYYSKEDLSLQFYMNQNIDSISRHFRECKFNVSVELKYFHSLTNLFSVPQITSALNYKMILPYPLGAYNLVDRMHTRKGCLYITMDDMQLNTVSAYNHICIYLLYMCLFFINRIY